MQDAEHCNKIVIGQQQSRMAFSPESNVRLGRVQEIVMSPQQTPTSFLPQQNFAHNFKARLFNADPETERKKEIVKQSYRMELQKQMQADKKRKEDEKRKMEEQDLKQERQFMQKIKIEAINNSNKQKLKDQAYYVMRSGGGNRQRRRGKASVPSSLTTVEVRPNQLQTRAKEQFRLPDAATQTVRLPQLVINRFVRDSQQRVLNQYSYQDQRISAIRQFQESILHKMQVLRQQIKYNYIDTNKQVQNVRTLLRAKPIISYSEDDQMLDFRVKRKVFQNRSFMQYKNRVRSHIDRPAKQLTESSEQGDFVELLPITISKPKSQKQTLS